MAEPFKSTPASRVFGMGLPRRSNLPPATFFDTPIYEERRNLTPTIRKNALAEQQMAAEEAALAAKQADIERQIQGQEAMSRAFSGIEQGEEIENIFRKNPAIVYSPQFGQLYQASNLMEPSKASKTLVPNLAKSLPPEFRSEFLATASDPKYLNDPLGAYTAIEMKKNIADQRGRLRAMGVDVSKLKPDYFYTPEEESDFKSKLSIEAKMAEIEQKKSEERERDLQEAKKWALKRGAQENMVNLLDSPSAIYQLGASIGGSRSGTASRDIIDRRSKIFNIAKDELEDAKRDFRYSAYDEPDVVEAKKKMLDEAQARYNQAKSDFEGALIEPPMEEDGVMGMQLPDYAPYSPEFRAGFASAAGSPAFGVPLGGRSTVPAKGRVAGETATNITSPAATGGGLPAPVPPSPSGIQVKQPAKPTTEEQIAAVKQLTDNPTALMQVIRSDGSIEAKKEALSKLQEFQKKLPTFQFQSGTPEEIDFIRRNLPIMVNEAKEVIDLEPFKQEVNKAWTTEKNNMASQIKDFAKALNVSPSLVEYWLANNVRYKTEGDPLSDAPARDISIREYFNEYLQNRVGKSLGEEADIMSRFSGSKYASKLGIGNKALAKALFTQALAPFLGPLAGDVAPGGKGPTYEKMLDAYLDEKLNLKPNPVAPQNGNANVGGVPKIQIGTPIKTSS